MLRTHDYVTLHVDGIRYLEKPPLPYWLAAFSLRLFAPDASLLSTRGAFAIHLPVALTVLALALLGYLWALQAFEERTAFLTALFTLTATGIFLFTRVFIPDAILSFFLALCLYLLLRALETGRPLYAYAMWSSLAFAVLTKGLVSLVFFFGTALVFLYLTKELPNLRRLRPFTGLLLFLLIATPWHILAGLRNKGGMGGHGFFWFYFVNEHYLRFLGRREPRDFNKVPPALYWLLHLVWLFPWSLFAPAAIFAGLRKRREILSQRDHNAQGEPLSRLEMIQQTRNRREAPLAPTFAGRTVLILGLFSVFVLVFFSLSTNQEYYTFPIYLPLLLLTATALSRPASPAVQRGLAFAYLALTVLGLLIAVALGYGLYTSRHLPYVSDIGSLLAHRGVGGYTLSMSSFFDLTGPSFAALRLPASLAAIAFATGPSLAWWLHARQKPRAALFAVAATSAAFLLAAHIALVRFAPLLSSQDFAAIILKLEAAHNIEPDTVVLLYSDQAYGSSIPFYLDRQVSLVDGRTTSMLFGSTFPDAPKLFLTHQELAAQWGTGPRKILFVPIEQRETVDRLLGPGKVLLAETSGKALFTDRPLNNAGLGWKR